MLGTSAAQIQSLYVHVPFCAQKCEYCAFYSESATGELINRYVAALVRELELVAVELQPKTIFFGGGTPSLLNLRQWETVLSAMARWKLLGASEFTVECNPATVSADKAKLLHSGGVNRISMGVQSLDETLLDRLGRVHSRDMVFRSYEILRRAGFDNVNLDLMFAIPGQTMETWRATLTEALALGSEHLSSYEVIYEEDTPLYAQLGAGEFDVDEDLACEMYEELLERSAASGFRQYEIANFAKDDAGCAPEPKRSAEHHLGQLLKPTTEASRCAVLAVPDRACRHNLNYWRGGSFYGLGPSATSYVRGVRTRNWSNTPLYCEQLEQGRRAIESREELSPVKRAGETAAFGLRMNCGLAFEEFRQVTGYDLRNEWAADMETLVARGWGVRSAERFHLTRAGLRFADGAAELFLR
jgi:oxygen-independent coproporphyrinogen III oxidase